MKSHFFALILFVITLISTPLSSWGLLEGRQNSAHADERAQFVKGLYKVYDPFYLGPLLAPSAHTLPKGYYNIQPYFNWQRTYGAYDSSWRVQRSLSSLRFTYLSVIQYGLTEFMDTDVVIQAFGNRSQKLRTFGYGDTSLSFGFQMLEGEIGTWIPSCKLATSINFPTGRFQNADPAREGTDLMGSGSYSPQISLNFQKEFNSFFKKDLDAREYYPFRFRWTFAYQINPPVKVKGINTYGGTLATNGKVKPGNNFTSIFAWEFSFNQHWVFATDWQYSVSSPSKFKGNTGGEFVGGPGNQNLSVAPAIEFSLNSNFGVLAGVQFSLAGRNSAAFVTGLFSFTYLF